MPAQNTCLVAASIIRIQFSKFSSIVQEFIPNSVMANGTLSIRDRVRKLIEFSVAINSRKIWLIFTRIVKLGYFHFSHCN